MSRAPSQLPSMQGRTVVITGANSGVGKATAVALARAGADTVITARSGERGRPPWPISGVTADRTALTWSCSTSATWLRYAGGPSRSWTAARRIDVLVNNAGLVQSVAHRDRGRLRGHLRHQPPGAVPPHPATDRAPGRRRPPPGWSTWPPPPIRPPVTAWTSTTSRPPGTTAACGPTAGPSWPTSCSPPSWPGGWRVPASPPTVSTPGTVATGFARDDDANGFLAFGIRLIKPFILTPEQGAADLGLPGLFAGRGRRHRWVLRQVPVPEAVAGRPGRGGRRPPVVGQRGAGGSGPPAGRPERVGRRGLPRSADLAAGAAVVSSTWWR